MALSKEWKERYMREMRAAQKRMDTLTKKYPNWHFEPPKTLPRSDYDAARRVTDFRRVNETAFRAGSTPRYVVYWTDVGIPTYGRGTHEVKKGTQFTRRQVTEAEQAWERERKAWKNLGLEGEPARYTPGTKAGREKYIRHRRSQNVEYNVQKKAALFKNNILKSLNKQLGRYEDMGLYDLLVTLQRCIDKINDMSYVAVWNAISPYLNKDGSSDLFQSELFGSGLNVLSESNLDKLAMILGVPTYTEDVTEEELTEDADRRAEIRELMLQDPPF